MYKNQLTKAFNNLKIQLENHDIPFFVEGEDYPEIIPKAKTRYGKRIILRKFTVTVEKSLILGSVIFKVNYTVKSGKKGFNMYNEDDVAKIKRLASRKLSAWLPTTEFNRLVIEKISE